MKYILFFFIFHLLSCSVPSQISWDKVKDSNVRHIGTKSWETKIDNATYNFGLTVFAGSGYKHYCLLISSLWRIEDNSVVLLKLGNDEVVKLVVNNINKGQVDWPSYSPIIGGNSYSGILTTKKADYYSAIYTLEEDTLNKIEKTGIYKIRIEFGNSYKEQIWIKDRLGKYIKNAHALLESQLQKPSSISNPIEHGF